MKRFIIAVGNAQETLAHLERTFPDLRWSSQHKLTDPNAVGDLDKVPYLGINPLGSLYCYYSVEQSGLALCELEDLLVWERLALTEINREQLREHLLQNDPHCYLEGKPLADWVTNPLGNTNGSHLYRSGSWLKLDEPTGTTFPVSYWEFTRYKPAPAVAHTLTLSNIDEARAAYAVYCEARAAYAVYCEAEQAMYEAREEYLRLYKAIRDDLESLPHPEDM